MNNMTVPEALHFYRQNLNSIGSFVQQWKPIELVLPGGVRRPSSTMEIVSALQRIGNARKWIGKLLGHVGEKAYAGRSTRAADIPPMTDEGTTLRSWTKKTHLEDVQDIRDQIEARIVSIETIRLRRVDENRLPASQTPTMSREEDIAWMQVYVHLVEAKMFLGDELGRLRDEANAGGQSPFTAHQNG